MFNISHPRQLNRYNFSNKRKNFKNSRLLNVYSLISAKALKNYFQKRSIRLRLLYTATILSQKTTKAGVYEKSPVSR